MKLNLVLQNGKRFSHTVCSSTLAGERGVGTVALQGAPARIKYSVMPTALSLYQSLRIVYFNIRGRRDGRHFGSVGRRNAPLNINSFAIFVSASSLSPSANCMEASYYSLRYLSSGMPSGVGINTCEATQILKCAPQRAVTL